MASNRPSHPLDPCRHIPPKIAHCEIGTDLQQLDLAPHGAVPTDAPSLMGKASRLGRIGLWVNDQEIGRILAPRKRSNVQALESLRRHVFVAVNGDVHALVEQRLFNFLGKESPCRRALSAREMPEACRPWFESSRTQPGLSRTLLLQAPTHPGRLRASASSWLEQIRIGSCLWHCGKAVRSSTPFYRPATSPDGTPAFPFPFALRGTPR